jgi:hypothetical protein
VRRGLDVLAALGLVAVGIIWAAQNEVTFGLLIAWLGVGVVAFRWDWPPALRPRVAPAWWLGGAAIVAADAIAHHRGAADLLIGLAVAAAVASVPLWLRLRRRT